MATENDDNILVTEQTDAAQAAEDAAFATAFNTERNEVPEPEVKPEPVETPEPEANAEVAPEPEAKAEVAPEPEAKAEVAPEAKPTPLSIAGLSEEQIATALSRAGALQGTVDKMAGRIGQLMQQVEQLKSNPPTTQAAQKAFDVKLDKLSAAFPELASLLKEDLQGMQTATAEPAPALPAGITQEQFDAALNERLAKSQATIQEQIEVKVLSVVHPDWLQVINTPQFALYRDNVLPPGVGKQLMESEDSSFIAKHLTDFKAWRDSAAKPTAEAVAPAPAARTVSSRLSRAVLPAGAAAPTVTAGAVTEEDGFAAGFNNERKKAGY